jgi:hypothetical protein
LYFKTSWLKKRISKTTFNFLVAMNVKNGRNRQQEIQPRPGIVLLHTHTRQETKHHGVFFELLVKHITARDHKVCNRLLGITKLKQSPPGFHLNCLCN